MKIANDHAGTNTWTLRTFTFLVWVAVGLCAAYWAFKFVTTKPVEATAAMATPAVVVDSKAIAKLLGATDNINIAAKSVSAPTVKLALFGLATTATGQGVALIATEDKPAKPYRVGAKVTDDLVLKSISKVDAVLAASITAPESQKLSLPDRKPATFVATAAAAQKQAPNVTLPVTNGATPAYPNTVGTLNPVLAESLRQPPISRFAPRAAGVAAGAPLGAPAMPVQAPVNPAMPTANTINPSAAAVSAATASAVTPQSAVSPKPDTATADGVAR